MNAYVRRDARQNQILDAARFEDHVKIRRVKRPLAGFIDEWFPVARSELGNDLPARLAAHQDSPAGPWITNPRPDTLRAPALVRGQVRQIGSMTFTRVNDQEALVSHHRHDRGDWLYRR